MKTSPRSLQLEKAHITTKTQHSPPQKPKDMVFLNYAEHKSLVNSICSRLKWGAIT